MSGKIKHFENFTEFYSLQLHAVELVMSIVYEPFV